MGSLYDLYVVNGKGMVWMVASRGGGYFGVWL